VEKLRRVAIALPELGVYGYTARRDLDWSVGPPNLCVNGSGWMPPRGNMFQAVERVSGRRAVCPGDCRVCNRCKVGRGEVIEVVMH